MLAATKSLEDVRSEFDAIADLSLRFRDLLGPHEAALLDQLPPMIGNALDVGCGMGAVARRLAVRSHHVVGIDISPRMIEQARIRSSAYSNIEYHVAEALEFLDANDSYDCVTSMAFLHHVDLEPTVQRMAGVLRPGGVLLLVDVLDRSGWPNLPLVAVSTVLAFLRTVVVGRGLPSLAVKRAWARHGRGERYLTIDTARDTFGRLLPGCTVREHLLFRYSVRWTKPAAA